MVSEARPHAHATVSAARWRRTGAATVFASSAGTGDRAAATGLSERVARGEVREKRRPEGVITKSVAFIGELKSLRELNCANRSPLRAKRDAGARHGDNP